MEKELKYAILKYQQETHAGPLFIAPVGPPGTGKSYIANILTVNFPKAAWTSIDDFKDIFEKYEKIGHAQRGRALQFAKTFAKAKYLASKGVKIIIIETGCTRASHCLEIMKLSPFSIFLVPEELCSDADPARFSCMVFRAFLDARLRETTNVQKLLWLAHRFEPFSLPSGSKNMLMKYKGLKTYPQFDPPNIAKLLEAADRDGEKCQELIDAIKKYTPIIIRETEIMVV